MSDLYKRSNYTNKDITALFDTHIIEYDLRHANTSLSREYGLVKNSILDKLDEMSNKQRNTRFGKMMLKDKKLAKQLENAFVDIRRRFVTDNDIDDEDILSIKKDALFIIDKDYVVKNTVFGKCEFVIKNDYIAYIYLSGLECLFAKTQDGISVDVKGINDTLLDKHRDYILDFLCRCVSLKLKGANAPLYRYISDFVSKYKFRELDVGYYRQLNANSFFVMNDSDIVYTDAEFIPDKRAVDISFNYEKVIVPLIGAII